jgi:pilus assembly protein CpaB
MPETVSIVVASTDIPRGRSIAAEMLATKDYPKELVPEGAILDKEGVLDRTVAVPVVKDEPILEAKLASKNGGRGAASLIPEGMRACTITANVSSAVAGLLLPGNRVDVLCSMTSTQANDGTGGATTTTLLENVEIFAIEHHIEAPAETKADPNVRTVTLLVTPDQAPELDLGQNKGTLHLTLRNPNDSKSGNPKPATLAGIQFHQEMVATEKPQETKPAPTLRTFRGTTEGDK